MLKKVKRQIAGGLSLSLIFCSVPWTAAAQEFSPMGARPLVQPFSALPRGLVFPEVVSFQLKQVQLLTPHAGLASLRSWALNEAPDFAVDRASARLLLGLIADPATTGSGATPKDLGRASTVKAALSPVVGDQNLADLRWLAGHFEAIARHDHSLANALAKIQEEFSLDSSELEGFEARLNQLFDGRGLVSPTVFAQAPAKSAAPERLLASAAAPVRHGLDFMRKEQRLDGSWTAPMLTSSVMHNCEMVFLYEILGLMSRKREKVAGLMNHVWSQQNQADGGFSVYSGGPSSDEISVEAYLAAKIAGEDELSEHMLKLERFIKTHDSLKNASISTLYMMLFRLKEAPPLLPGALFTALLFDPLLPYIRVLIYPFLFLFESANYHVLKASQVPGRLGLKTIPIRHWPRSPLGFGGLEFFEWVKKNINENGLMFDFTSPAVPTLVALATQSGAYSELIERGVQTLESFMLPIGDHRLAQGFGLADVGETMYTMLALLDMGVSPDDPMVKKAEAFLWSARHPKTGAFGFSVQNRHFPDVDDTAVVICVLKRLAMLRGDDGVDEKLWQGLDWILGLQNPDGGFGTYERDKIPGLSGALKWLYKTFGRFPVIMSESIVEHTARVVLTLSLFKDESPKIEAAHEKAVRWLLRARRKDGRYPATWFVANVFGTAMALSALATKSDNADVRSAIDQGLDYIESHQNPDGGFSESPESFAKGRSIPLAHSSPAQTGMIVTQLMTLLSQTGEAYQARLEPMVKVSIDYLLKAQKEDGLWHDPTWFAVVSPEIEYLTYRYIKEVTPLYALGMYYHLLRQAPFKPHGNKNP